MSRKLRVARAIAAVLYALLAGGLQPAPAQHFDAPVRIDSGRFTFVMYPADEGMARSLLDAMLRVDTFPGLPRPVERVLIGIAPDSRTFREWIGPNAPEWGSAVAFPGLSRIILQGSGANSSAGDPRVVLRHELAHLAINEYLGGLVPHWFDEGYASYAAGETAREAVLAANVWLVLKGVPPLDSLDTRFQGSSSLAQAGYALSHLAVAELASLDESRGLTLYFRYWKESGSMELAVRRAYGLTLNAFESRWRSSVKRRYGIMALFADLSVLGLGVLIVFLPIYLLRRARMRERLEEMKRAEALAQARLEAERLQQLLGPGPENGAVGSEGSSGQSTT